MERISKYRDTVEITLPKMKPLTAAFIVCMAMAIVGLIYICANPAIDAGALAGR